MGRTSTRPPFNPNALPQLSTNPIIGHLIGFDQRFLRSKFMTLDARGNFIDGNWSLPASPQGRIQRFNPADPTHKVAEIPWDSADVERAIAAATRAQRPWARRPQQERIHALHRFRDALAKCQEAMARQMTLEMGKPIWESRGEAGALLKKIDIMCDEGLRVTADHHPDGLHGGWTHRPLGVLAVLGPYNFPLHLANGHIIPALVTGNAVVVKPSEVTPLSMQLYVECAHEAGLPDGLINLVQGPGPVGAALSSHRHVDGVLFTGSYDTGVKIREANVDQPGKLLALEMGGKNTTLVLDDADLQQAAHGITQSACMTTGQRCSATSRVVLHRDVADDMIDLLKDLFRRVTSDDPFATDPEPLMGPLATRAGYDGFVAAQQDDENGTLSPLLKGGPAGDPDDGYFVKPALWRAHDVDPDGSHQGRELFGPDVVIYVADDDRQAAEIANATHFGLAMSVFTANEKRFDDLAYELKAGILNLNGSTVGASSRLPFGGVKRSGNHRPAAILAGRYCTFPMASLRHDSGFDPDALAAGPLSRLAPRD